jgi:hypothetical protein
LSAGALKSNMSSSASLFASRVVRAPSFQIASIRRVIDVCEWVACETYPARA